jgi:hypothetical protein
MITAGASVHRHTSDVDSPYGGLIQISSTPMDLALSHLGN